jgi:hypothetical protein
VRGMVYSLCLALRLLLAVGGLVMSLQILQNAAPIDREHAKAACVHVSC